VFSLVKKGTPERSGGLVDDDGAIGRVKVGVSADTQTATSLLKSRPSVSKALGREPTSMHKEL
jgi:hypothetical protein